MSGCCNPGESCLECTQCAPHRTFDCEPCQEAAAASLDMSLEDIRAALRESTTETVRTFFKDLKDNVNQPAHYKQHPSGLEAIQVTEHFNFNRGNAIKYIWRAEYKGSELEDLKKARFYIDREIQRMEKS